MKIKNGIVIEDDFLSTFQELLNKDTSAKQCLELSTCFDELLSHVNIVRRTKRSLIEKYAKKNNDGEIQSDEKGAILFDDGEKKQKCLSEINEILNESIDIPLSETVKIYTDEIMTPRKVRLLKDVIEIVEREQPEKEKVKEK